VFRNKDRFVTTFVSRVSRYWVLYVNLKRPVPRSVGLTLQWHYLHCEEELAPPDLLAHIWQQFHVMDDGWRIYRKFRCGGRQDTGVRRNVCSLWRVFRIQRNDLGEISLLTGILLKVVLYRASDITRLCADMTVFVIVKQPWSGVIHTLIGLHQFPL